MFFHEQSSLKLFFQNLFLLLSVSNMLIFVDIVKSRKKNMNKILLTLFLCVFLVPKMVESSADPSKSSNTITDLQNDITTLQKNLEDLKKAWKLFTSSKSSALDKRSAKANLETTMQSIVDGVNVIDNKIVKLSNADFTQFQKIVDANAHDSVYNFLAKKDKNTIGKILIDSIFLAKELKQDLGKRLGTGGNFGEKLRDLIMKLGALNVNDVF